MASVCRLCAAVPTYPTVLPGPNKALLLVGGGRTMVTGPRKGNEKWLGLQIRPALTQRAGTSLGISASIDFCVCPSRNNEPPLIFHQNHPWSCFPHPFSPLATPQMYWGYPEGMFSSMACKATRHSDCLAHSRCSIDAYLMELNKVLAVTRSHKNLY